MSILLKRGNRGLLVGKTGSGKTQNAIFQLRHVPVYPVFILDTKIEDAFFGVPEDGEEIELVQSIEELKELAKRKRDELPEYVLIRPSVSEVVDVDALNSYTEFLYYKFGACFIYFDELYNWHRNGLPGSGLIALYTRGRSKGKTVLGATQRPSWISRFCITEVDKYYLHRLMDLRDRKTLDSVVPDFSSRNVPPEFHFYHFDASKHDAAQLYAPVPYQELDRRKIFSRKWL